MTQEIKHKYSWKISTVQEGAILYEDDQPIASVNLDKADFLANSANNFYPILEACKNLLKLIEYETDLPYSAANGNQSPNGILDEGVVMTQNLINTAIDVVKKAEAQGARDE